MCPSEIKVVGHILYFCRHITDRWHCLTSRLYEKQNISLKLSDLLDCPDDLCLFCLVKNLHITKNLELCYQKLLALSTQ